MYYPLFIDVQKCACLIVGGGEVGFRKAQSLLKAGACRVLVLDIEPFNDYWNDLAHSSLELEKRLFNEADLQGMSLVFACTGNKDFNAKLSELCAQQNILCNCVDAPSKGTFIVPALAKIEGKCVEDSCLMAAVSTEGASPAWSRFLRMELEQWLKPYAPMTIFLGRLRPLVLGLKRNTKDNTLLFRTLVHSPLRQYLADGQVAQCRLLLRKLLPTDLHKHIAELLYDII